MLMRLMARPMRMRVPAGILPTGGVGALDGRGGLQGSRDREVAEPGLRLALQEDAPQAVRSASGRSGVGGVDLMWRFWVR
jgi:hypothetical protein